MKPRSCERVSRVLPHQFASQQGFFASTLKGTLDVSRSCRGAGQPVAQLPGGGEKRANLNQSRELVFPE